MSNESEITPAMRAKLAQEYAHPGSFKDLPPPKFRKLGQQHRDGGETTKSNHRGYSPPLHPVPGLADKLHRHGLTVAKIARQAQGIVYSGVYKQVARDAYSPAVLAAIRELAPGIIDAA